MNDRPANLRRRKTPWIVGTLMVVSLALLLILQSTNLWKEFAIESSSDLLLLYALSSLNFIAFVIFGFIFLRSITKLVRERRTFALGAQIKTRLLIYFFAVSLLPIIAMAVFSYLFMNRALERWFTQIPGNVIREARDVQQNALKDRVARFQSSADMLAVIIGTGEPSEGELRTIVERGHLHQIRILNTGGEPLVYGRQLTADEEEQLKKFTSGTGGPALPVANTDVLDFAASDLPNGRRLLLIRSPAVDTEVSGIVENSVLEFEKLKDKQVIVRQVGLLTLGVLTFLLMFASSWIAFYVARGLTAPIKALAEGADEIARGNFGHRVDVLAEDELALLVTTFNQMSGRLESNSKELVERRKYIETVLDTLPTGVISFDDEGLVTTINRAAASMLRFEGELPIGVGLDGLLREENRTSLEALIRRARRVGFASDQTILRAANPDGDPRPEEELTVALTASALPEKGGVVLVIEDLSELIAAQRASAWQEVARRMAHEIKNPLTPIQLAAERIAKKYASVPAVVSSVPVSIPGKSMDVVVKESTSTILREVQSLKTMVDEFSRFARLPNITLRPGDLNETIKMAAAVFTDEHAPADIALELTASLPEVLLDAEQIKRVFVNLIQNSIEAFPLEHDDPRVIITTRVDSARDIIVAEVSDNGRGIEPRDLPKLFQPYFSTKGRGTGLGLAIVHRVIAEHKGKIKAVPNPNAGAKFIIELPLIG